MDLSKLNKEQLEAVTHENGPLLIIAGAGTGKTHVITSRILWLLNEKKATTNSILALTFTEKATEEMIERIDMALPYSYEELSIHTFHGFCDKVLRQFGLEIGLDTSYKILTQIDQWMFIKKHLFDFELDYYRPMGNPGKFISALGTHFSRLKDEDISPEKYLEYAEKYDEDETEKSRLLELANAYKKYQELLIKENMMDFNDLQFYVLRLFEQRPQILKQLQERYKQIMVDEFQDTNFAQSKIVHELAKGHKNLTVVGDDDQSIYRWRGASMNNINEFNREFPEAKKIVLKENYRSVPSILNASYELIQNNNPFRLEASHDVNKKLNSQFESEDKVQITKYLNYVNEYKSIIKQIREYVDSDYDYKDIAILVRTHGIAKPVIEALKANNVPFVVKSSETITSLPEIKDLIAVLKFIANQNDDLALFRILQMPIYNFPMATLVSLVNKAKNEQLRLLEVAREEDFLKEIMELFSELVEYSKDHNCSQILSRFLTKAEYIQKLDDDEKLLNIAEFVKMVQEYDSQHDDKNIYSFLDYLSLLEEAGAKIDSTISEIDHNAVQILTIHAAKGLQFPIVFLPSLVHTRFPGRNMSDPIAIPDELITEEIPEKDMHLYEERRLMYVACTRAKEKLHISLSEKYEGNKKWKPSVFVKELTNLDEVEYSENNEEIQEQEESPKVVQKEMNLSPTPSKLSYSKLTTFEACPLKYKYRYIYNIPSPMTAAANFGVSVHNTLNEFYEELKQGKEADLDLMNELYEKNWIPYGYESRAHHNTRKHQGLKIIKDYYEENSKEWKVPEMLERAFNLKVGKYAFSGRIDRIDKLNDGTYEVIDYKTGKSKKGSKLEKDLQLSLYALACRDVYGIEASKLSLYFLEDNEKQSTSRTNDDLNKAEEEISAKADALMNSDFCATPGFACKFCEYRLICNKAV